MHVVRFRTAGSIRIFERIASISYRTAPLVLREDIFEGLHAQVAEDILLVVSYGTGKGGLAGVFALFSASSMLASS